MLLAASEEGSDRRPKMRCCCEPTYSRSVWWSAGVGSQGDLSTTSARTGQSRTNQACQQAGPEVCHCTQVACLAAANEFTLKAKEGCSWGTLQRRYSCAESSCPGEGDERAMDGHQLTPQHAKSNGSSYYRSQASYCSTPSDGCQLC